MEVLATLYNADEGKLVCAKELTMPDGSTILAQHVFPDDALEWRAAEYDLDPDDVDTLMDVVLYEPHLDPDPVADALLYTASTIEEARARLLQRVMGKKTQLRPQGPNKWKTNEERAARLLSVGAPQFWVDAITDDALLRIRTESIIHREVIAEKRRIVDRTRQGRKADVAERRLNRRDPQARARSLRSQLEYNRNKPEPKLLKPKEKP